MKSFVMTAAIAGLIATTVSAQTPDPGAMLIAQAAINADGHSCARVTTLEPLGRTTSGDALLRAVCDDGVHWVLEIDPSTTEISRVVECAMLQAHGARITCN